jgi:hypothetical protein
MREMKGIEIKNRCLYFYGNPIGYADKNGFVLDNMFRCDELENWLAKQSLTLRWTDGVYDRFVCGEQVQAGELPVPLKSCRIWQLKPDVDIMKKFIGYQEMTEKYGEPYNEDYNLVYDGQIETNDLEDIWTKFNARHPPGYAGYSLSMSDVIELYDHNGSEFHYVDRIGFKQISFNDLGSEQVQNMTMSM